MAEFRQIALLIDADNTQLSKLRAIVEHLSQRGRICIRRAFGNWSLPQMKNWEPLMNRLGICAEQHFSYTGQKNATDIALAIAAIDLLHNTNCDAYAIVSSDSDFTPLAIRLREAGAYVIGYGKGKGQTPESFRYNCHDFVQLETLDPEEEDAVPTGQAGSAAPAPAILPPVPLVLEENFIHEALRNVAASKEDTDRYVLLTEAGIYLHEQNPHRKLNYAGHTKLLAFVESHPERYDVSKEGDGPQKNIRYRCLDNGAPAPSIPLSRVHLWLRRLSERSPNADGYTTAGSAGYHLRRLAEEEGKAFNVKQYQHASISKFLKAYPKLYAIREEMHNGTTIISYKSL